MQTKFSLTDVGRIIVGRESDYDDIVYTYAQNIIITKFDN